MRPSDQGRDREGIGDREADIADIEQRRVDREAEILQDRVEVLPLPRRRDQTPERIRGQQREGEEGDADTALRRERAGPQLRRQRTPRQCDQRAEQHEDEDPEQHRALVVPPDRGQLVDQRLRRMRIGRDVLDREIGDHIGRHQAAEGERDQKEAGDRRRRADGGQGRIVPAHAPQRHDRLDDRDTERQCQSEMTDLDEHRRGPISWPAQQARRAWFRRVANGPASSAHRRPRAAYRSRHAWRGRNRRGTVRALRARLR